MEFCSWLLWKEKGGVYREGNLAGLVTFIQASTVGAVSAQDNMELTPEAAVETLEAAVETLESSIETSESSVGTEMVCENVEKTERGYIVETDNQTVSVNEDNEIQIVTDDEDEIFEVGVSFLFDGEEIETTEIDDVIVMDDKDNEYHITTEVFEGGLRNSFIIEENCSEESFPIQLDLPEGAYIEFSKDEYEDNKMDGSILIRDVEGEILGAIDIPWAIDANGNNVETYYKIEGNTVIQYVNHRNVENIQYPIVADPLLAFKSCFKSGKWITRNGVVSLSLKPKAFLRLSMLQGSSSMRKYSWDTVVSKFKKSKKWKNTSSMKDQYYCHWYFASLKSTFNLEPSRKKTSWLNMVTHMCNP